MSKFTEAGYSVKSVTKGSEWSRIGFSYNWTVVLEYDESAANIEDANEIKSDIQARSSGKNIGFLIGLIGIALAIILVAILVLTV